MKSPAVGEFFACFYPRGGLQVFGDVEEIPEWFAATGCRTGLSLIRELATHLLSHKHEQGVSFV